MTQGFHIHPIQAAALDPNEILRESEPILSWLHIKEPDQKSTWEKLKKDILIKDAKPIWEQVENLHLRLSSKDPKQEKALLSWSLLQSLHRGFLKWEQYAFPYKAIFEPPTHDLVDAESRCREALLLSMSFYPFLEKSPNKPKENENPRHCLAYTLLSCLHSETPTLEGDLKKLREMAFSKKVTPRTKGTPKETPQERVKILTQTILMLSYGGAISKTEWSRPSQDSITSLLKYIYNNKEGRITHLIPQETQEIHAALIRLKLI